MNLAVNTKLKLPTSPRTAVFRAVVAQLKRDPVLARNIPVDSWLTWDGDPRAKKPLPKTAPAIRLTPVNGPFAWSSPGQQVGALIVLVELSIATTCVDDVMNLWGAIEQAMYPADVPTANAFVIALQQAGAHTGQVLFSVPAFDPIPDEDGDGTFHATGQFKIDVRLNT